MISGGNEEFLRDIIGRMKKKIKIGEEKEEEFLYLGMEEGGASLIFDGGHRDELPQIDPQYEVPL